MNQKKWPYRIQAGGTLLGLGILWLLTLWLAAVTPSSARDGFPALLTFKSPIGDPLPSIVKEANVPRPRPGDEIEYTITYSTTENGSQVFNVRLYDFLPAGATYVSSEPPAEKIDNGILLFTYPTVGTDGVTATVRVRVQEGYEQLRNYTLATADFITPTYAYLTTPVEQPPVQLRLTKSGYEHVLVGGELAYTLRCENDSDIAVHDVTVVDVLPTGLPLVAASPAPDEVTLPLLTWSLGTLAPGASRTIIVTTTAPSEASVITNTALAAGHLRAMTTTTWATTVVTEAAILSINKTASAAEVDVGDEVVYTIRYRNIGNIAAMSATLTDTLPEAVRAIGTHPPATLTPHGQLVWDLGHVPTGTVEGKIIITVTVEGNWGGTLHNTAAIGAPGGFGGQATADVRVRLAHLYLPVMFRQGGG